MLKLEADKIDDIPEPFRGAYEEKDGKFRLKVDGLEDTSALKRAKDHEKEERKKAAERARQLEEQLAEMRIKLEGDEAERLKKSGDIEAINKSWQEKLSKKTGELSDQLSARDNLIRKLTVGSTAQAIASEIAVPGSAKALMPHIEGRLSMELRDGQPAVVVLDASGKPSAMTVEEFKAEIAADPAFAPLIVASKASGAGGTGNRGGGGGGDALPKTYAECKTPAQKAEWLRVNRQAG